MTLSEVPETSILRRVYNLRLNQNVGWNLRAWREKFLTYSMSTWECGRRTFSSLYVLTLTRIICDCDHGLSEVKIAHIVTPFRPPATSNDLVCFNALVCYRGHWAYMIVNCQLVTVINNTSRQVAEITSDTLGRSMNEIWWHACIVWLHKKLFEKHFVRSLWFV